MVSVRSHTHTHAYTHVGAPQVEIVVLAMQYEPPDDSGENPIVMLAESTFAMVFATSSAWLFAFFFEPQEAIGIAKAL